MKLLSKYVEFKNGKKRPTSKGTIPVYGGNGILDYTNTANMQSGVVIGRVGVYCGSVFLVREKCWVSDNAIKAMCKENMDLGYLYYLLSSLHLNERRIGTSQPLLTQSILNNIEVEIPELAIQKKISSILELLDEKIKLNNEINNNLEQQAQAIFKSWFIDLEPFSNRKPSDWSVSTLGNVSIMGAGGDKPQNVSPIKTDLYKYPIYSNGLSNEGLYGFTDKPKISEESVTVSARGTIGFVCLRHIPYVPIVRLITLTPKTEIISAKYLYLWLKQLHITGTGTTQQQLTVPYFQKTEILVPSQEIVTLFTTTVDPIFEKIWANQNENEKLSSLRDTLLPKLMSGELDVSGIDL
ncbi:Putative type-1 restriction enzyme specificity protein MPN_089 [[Ruminococcus] torques]|jgi:putative restriction modification system DNA specificity subunit|uniref:Type-1 restriction enzyme specificity protein MPN_089 n=2 Tax=[Ruminococcus] torques TaxID=33039 RepID=A0A6N3F909_9FIRM